MATEAKIQTSILVWLKSKGVVCNKTILMGKAGWPDIICCFKGKFLGLEVKKPGGKTTKLQDYKLAELEAAGAVVKVVKSVEEVEELFLTL